ncbi:MAG: beta-propeller domain-containing protein [Cystobacterineae bacterium]|nr:beta-propeller domain-containing protein [Cystobacterineae bacterium]
MHKTTLPACCSLLFLGVLLSSCKEESLPKENFPRFNQRLSAALQLSPSCTELETQARNAAFLRIQERYSSFLENTLGLLSTVESEFCQYKNHYDTLALPASAESAASRDSTSASQVSGTNNQIAEVDEADVIKADTQHIYVAKGNQLIVFKSWPPDELEKLSSAEIEGQAKRLLKVDNKLLVISFVDENPYEKNTELYGSEPYGGANLDPWPPTFSKTILTLFELNTPTSLKQTRKLSFKARFETARSIGDAAILVLSQPEQLWINHYWYPDMCNGTKLASEKKLRADYIRALNEAYEEILRLPTPQFGLHIEDSETGPSTLCNNLFLNPISDGTEQTTVVRLDLSKNSPPESASLLSRPGEVFVSENNVYMAVSHWHSPNSPWLENWGDQYQISLIHKFALNPSPAYVASGIVKGHVLNSFSMDEASPKAHEANAKADVFLRIATTTSPTWWTNTTNPQENILSVLKQEGSTLELHGQLSGLAYNEQIRSARFAGNRAYIVTFRQVDPLFAIDLSEPSHPRLLGELKIPGFSTYIHPLNDERLLTVGYDADENTGLIQGIQIQLFDVSKPEALRRIAFETLSRYSSSEAAQTHLGFSYYAPLNLLALPVTEWDPYYYATHFEGIRLFHVNPETGFQLRGSIPHPQHPTLPFDPYSSSVLRNIFMQGEAGDFLYSLSNNALFATQLNSATPQPVSQVFFE